MIAWTENNSRESSGGWRRGLRPARAGVVVYLCFSIEVTPKGCLYIPVSTFPACLQAPAEGKIPEVYSPEVTPPHHHTHHHLRGINLLCLFNELQCWGGGSRLLAGGDGVFQRTLKQTHPLLKVPQSSWALCTGRVHQLRGGHLLLAELFFFCFRAPVFTCDSFPPCQKLKCRFGAGP